ERVAGRVPDRRRAGRLSRGEPGAVWRELADRLHLPAGHEQRTVGRHHRKETEGGRRVGKQVLCDFSSRDVRQQQPSRRPLVGDVQDCYLTAGSPTSSFCGLTTLNAGFDGTSASRALLQFNLSAIPSTNTVVSAKLLLFLGSASTSTAATLSVYQLTQSWTTG